MANKVIGDYAAASTIDGTTHFLLIQPGSSSTAYKKINRNVLLGVTGQPMDISSTQTVSNKILDNTNLVTLLDGSFTLQNNVDTTKRAIFSAAGITTATTRTYTLPNASSTLADISTAQTLTNKTLTAPVINNGAITGTTITTDAIVGQSSATSGTVYGLSVASSKVGTNGVITASVTDSAITPAKLFAGTGASWAWQTWTPTWAGITTGNGVTTTAKYIQIGKTVFFRIVFTCGSTSALASGVDTTFSLPVTSASGYNASASILGNFWFNHIGTNYYRGDVCFSSTTVAVLVLNKVATTDVVAKPFNSANATSSFAASDIITAEGFYEAA